jgi:hypothetical protein
MSKSPPTVTFPDVTKDVPVLVSKTVSAEVFDRAVTAPRPCVAAALMVLMVKFPPTLRSVLTCAFPVTSSLAEGVVPPTPTFPNV